MDYITLIINFAPMVIALASAVAMLTPTDVDNKAISWARKFVDVLALNVANAKPATKKPDK